MSERVLSTSACSGGSGVRACTVHVAQGRVHAIAQAARVHGEEWLSVAESARLRALRAPLRQSQFLAGRWLVRQMLADTFGGQVHDWRLSAPDAGPPRVLAAPALAAGDDLNLSLSHSADYVCCAVSLVSIGIDLESPRRTRELREIAALVCTTSELTRLHASDDAVYATEFYAMWTLKEAWLKCGGRALSPAQLATIQTRRADSLDVANAYVWRARGYTLALACARPPVGIRWVLSSDDLGAGDPWHVHGGGMAQPDGFRIPV